MADRSRLRMTPRGDEVAGRIVDAFGGEVAVGEEVAHAFALRCPVLVETGDGQRIRHIHLIHEFAHLVDDVLHLGQPHHVERGGAFVFRIDADGAGHAADHEVGMRVLAAEDGVQLDHVALPGERVEVMRQCHQIGFRRQLVGGVAPVAVGEDAELAALDEALHLLLHVGEIAGRGARIGRADRLRQLRGGFRVGLQCGHHIHPVQRMQMIEVHHMVVDVLRADHQVADQLRVGGDLVFAAHPPPRAPRRCRAPGCTRRRCAARKPRRRAGRGRAG